MLCLRIVNNICIKRQFFLIKILYINVREIQNLILNKEKDKSNRKIKSGICNKDLRIKKFFYTLSLNILVFI